MLVKLCITLHVCKIDTVNMHICTVTVALYMIFFSLSSPLPCQTLSHPLFNTKKKNKKKTTTTSAQHHKQPPSTTTNIHPPSQLTNHNHHHSQPITTSIQSKHNQPKINEKSSQTQLKINSK